MAHAIINHAHPNHARLKHLRTNHAHGRPADPPLDPTRIAANAGAIALNATLLLLLLVPLSLPDQNQPLIDKPTEFIWIPRPKPVEPPRPIEVPVVRKPSVQPPSLVTPQPRIETPPMPPVVDSRPGDRFVAAVETAPTAGLPAESTGTPGPVVGARLQALSAPPPPYPREALHGRLSGTVMLEILVGVDGRPVEVTVLTSSGHRVLDQAARRIVLSRWTFEPAMRGGSPVQALGRVPIEFKLD